jgi:hypothetical protein
MDLMILVKIVRPLLFPRLNQQFIDHASNNVKLNKGNDEEGRGSCW